MTAEMDVPVEERVLQLLRHLGILKAHFAGSVTGDWQGLALAHPEVISSLTLVCPFGLDPSPLPALGSRLLVFSGDRGPPAEALRRIMANLSEATLATLHDYFSPVWADVIADRKGEVEAIFLDFLSGIDAAEPLPSLNLPDQEGEVAGISYRVMGSGPPLVLLPLALAPSQWEPLLPQLTQHYSTITFAGQELGFAAILESRARSGYLGVVRELVEQAHLHPGESVLEVGCGTGALDRWLAHRTSGANRILGLDLSGYLLREATALASKEGLAGTVEFKEGSAYQLPFPDGSFDLAMSCTVLEEGDADRMLEEMVRVLKPGGRVAAAVRALDMSFYVNLPLRDELKRKAEATPFGAVVQEGCADASLYSRLVRAGLTQVKMFPQLAAMDDSSLAALEFYQRLILSNLSAEEVEEWEAARQQARDAGTFFISGPFHCAVGTKI